MRMYLLQEAGADSCEESRKGPSIKKQVQEGWCCPGDFPQKKERVVVQSCPTLCDHTYCSLPGSSVHGIFQARILEWVAISFSTGASQLRDQTWVSHIAGRFFTI